MIIDYLLDRIQVQATLAALVAGGHVRSEIKDGVVVYWYDASGIDNCDDWEQRGE